MLNSRTQIFAKHRGNLAILTAWGIPHTLIHAHNGQPIAALITTGHLAEVYHKLLKDFHTTGLWPVSTDDIDHPWLTHTFRPEPFAPTPPPFPQRYRARPFDAPPEVLLCPSLAAPTAILVVPVHQPADVPAALGWNQLANYQLSSNDITGFLRSWEDRYGAVLVNIGADKLDLLVTHPPYTKPQTLEIAEEIHYACPGIIVRNGNTIQVLAEMIEVSDTWYFWWE